MPTLNTMLNHPEDFDTWFFRLDHELRMMSLDDLVRSEIPRPLIPDDAGANWCYLSIAVKLWMEQSVGEKLLHEINARFRDIILADDLIDAIRAVVVDME